MENLKKILDLYLENIPKKKKYKEYFIAFKWQEIVGKEIAKHIHPAGIKFHTLFLTSDTPSWAHEIMYMKEKIIDKVNLIAAQKIITEIKFTPFQKAYKIENKPLFSEEKKDTHLIPLPEEKVKAEEFFAKNHQSTRSLNKKDFKKKQELQQKLQNIYANSLAQKRIDIKNGYHKCKKCNNLCPKEETICFTCRRQKIEYKKQKIKEYLCAVPWANYSEIYAYVQTEPKLIESVKSDLLHAWAKNVRAEDKTSMHAKKLVMLYKSIKPEELTEEIIKKNLYKLRFDILSPQDKNIFHKKKKYKQGEYYAKSK